MTVPGNLGECWTISLRTQLQSCFGVVLHIIATTPSICGPSVLLFANFKWARYVLGFDLKHLKHVINEPQLNIEPDKYTTSDLAKDMILYNTSPELFRLTFQVGTHLLVGLWI